MEPRRLRQPAPPSPRRAVFLDRDGVLCENPPAYVKSWAEFRWLPRSLEGLRLLSTLPFSILLVTNQSAVNRGLTTWAQVEEIHARMRAEIGRAGARLDAVYTCPHRPDEGCACRKPGRKLFERAAAEWNLDFAGSYLIGDSRTDVEAGRALNVEVILVRTGLGQIAEARLDGGDGVTVCADLLDAATWIRGHVSPLVAERDAEGRLEARAWSLAVNPPKGPEE